MSPEWDCIVSKDTCFYYIFMETEKKSKEIFRYKKKPNSDLSKNHE